MESNQFDPQVLEATSKFIKDKMKDWKESNVNMIKESLITLQKMIDSGQKVPKRVFVTYASFICDKIGDIKVAKIIADLLMALAECLTPKFIASQMVKWASKAKNVKNLEESCNVLVSLCAEFGAG